MKIRVSTLKMRLQTQWNQGKVGWALLWLLGVPLPVLLIFYLLTGHH